MTTRNPRRALKLELLENREVPAVATITAIPVSVLEGNTGSTVALARFSILEAINRDVAIYYATSDGTAKVGSDYAKAQGRVTIPAGKTFADLPITIWADRATEKNETFTLSYSSPGNVIRNRYVRITILDDDLIVTPVPPPVPPAPPVRTIVPFGVTAHVQNTGDVAFRHGEWGGTKQALRMEGFQIDFDRPVPGLGLEYMAHLQDIGDTPWVPAGQFVGTRAQSRRLQGFAIRLTGPEAGNYVAVYRAHLQNIGDTVAYTNGEFCGTRTQPLRVQSMYVSIIPKEQYQPGPPTRLPGGDLRGRWAGPLEGEFRAITSQYLGSTSGRYYRRNSEKVFQFDYNPESDTVTFGAEIYWKARFGGPTALKLYISGTVKLGSPSEDQIVLSGDAMGDLEDNFGVDFDRLRKNTAKWFVDKPIGWPVVEW
jgi:hypothetical protein